MFNDSKQNNTLKKTLNPLKCLWNCFWYVGRVCIVNTKLIKIIYLGQIFYLNKFKLNNLHFYIVLKVFILDLSTADMQLTKN